MVAQLIPVFRGATCSGKTTLAKHLNGILPDSVIIHQDVCYSADHNLFWPNLTPNQDFAPVCIQKMQHSLISISYCPFFPSLKSSCLSIPFTMSRIGTHQQALFHGIDLLSSFVTSRRQVLSHPITEAMITSMNKRRSKSKRKHGRNGSRNLKLSSKVNQKTKG
jgi:energy-coupling factor transporter ATP-binding protein EcfA2